MGNGRLRIVVKTDRPCALLCVGLTSSEREIGRLVTALEASDLPVDTRTATAKSLAAVADAVDDSREWADCVVLLLEDGPSPDARTVIEAVTAAEPSLPLVVAAGSGVDAAAVLDAGATDCLRWTEEPGAGALLATRVGQAVESGRVDGEAVDVLERYRTIVESVDDPMYLLDGAGRFELVNDAIAQLHGLERDQYEGEFIGKFMDDAEYEAALETVRSLLDEGRRRGTVEYTLESESGEERIGEAGITVLTDESGDHIGTVGVVRDVTERQERVAELARYEAIVETAPIGLLVVDEAGVIRWHNEEFTGDLGIDGCKLVGTNFLQLVEEGFFPGYEVEYNVGRVKHLLDPETDNSLSFEQEWVDADGEPGVTEVNMRLLPLEDGEFAGSVFAFRNVTDRLAYQRELERQNARLEDFAGFVSHDLRNPLNVADGYVEVLQERYPEDDSLGEVAWAHERIAELIDDLLTLAHEGRSIADPVSFPFADVVEDAWSAVDTEDATLELDVGPDVEFRGDPGRVKNLLENCFRNSLTHGRQSGDESLTVRVAVQPGRGASGSIGAIADAGFTVEDDGCGLPDHDVFESGFSTAEDGTGLGLAIVREIVDAHGWEIQAGESADGGARFDVTGIKTDGDPGPGGATASSGADGS